MWVPHPGGRCLTAGHIADTIAYPGGIIAARWTPGLSCGKSVAERYGGPGRDRTDDLFHAMEARSQLRHRPTIEDKKPKAR
jgi:hypothetical protein